MGEIGDVVRRRGEVPVTPRCTWRLRGTVPACGSGLPLRASAGIASSCPAAAPILMMPWRGLMPALKFCTCVDACTSFASHDHIQQKEQQATQVYALLPERK